MQLKSFNHKVTQDFVYATFVGNITKLLPIESFKLSFERLMVFIVQKNLGTWKCMEISCFISSQVIQEVIKTLVLSVVD